MTKVNGFTLIEMMIVLTIISIMLALVTPSISKRFKAQQRIEAQTRIPIFIHNYIEKAYEEGRTYEVDFSQGSDNVWSIEITGGGTSDLMVLPRSVNLVTTPTSFSISETGKILNFAKDGMEFEQDDKKIFTINATTVGDGVIDFGKIDIEIEKQ